MNDVQEYGILIFVQSSACLCSVQRDKVYEEVCHRGRTLRCIRRIQALG